MATYIQNFNISEMAKMIGLNPSEKKEFNISIDGLGYNSPMDSYTKIHVEKIRITEAKNGHTTLKVWGRWFYENYDERTNAWYREHTTEIAWHIVHPETLVAIQNEITR